MMSTTVRRKWKGDGTEGYAIVEVLERGDHESMVRIKEAHNVNLRPEISEGDEVKVYTNKLYPIDDAV